MATLISIAFLAIVKGHRFDRAGIRKGQHQGLAPRRRRKGRIHRPEVGRYKEHISSCNVPALAPGAATIRHNCRRLHLFARCKSLVRRRQIQTMAVFLFAFLCGVCSKEVKEEREDCMQGKTANTLPTHTHTPWPACACMQPACAGRGKPPAGRGPSLAVDSFAVTSMKENLF